jgi:hypothetical protein
LHSAANHPLAPEKTFPPSFVLLSTPDVIAFLDIAPLTRGHVLVATRRHRVKTVELSTAEGAEVRLFCFSLLVPHLAFWEFHISCSKSTMPPAFGRIYHGTLVGESRPLHTSTLLPPFLVFQRSAVLLRCLDPIFSYCLFGIGINPVTFENGVGRRLMIARGPRIHSSGEFSH